MQCSVKIFDILPVVKSRPTQSSPPRPNAAAALASVVNVRLVSESSSNRFSAARLVCMRLAMVVLLSCWAFINQKPVATRKKLVKQA